VYQECPRLFSQKERYSNIYGFVEMKPIPRRVGGAIAKYCNRTESRIQNPKPKGYALEQGG
jgi:hypothetical protein